MPNTIGNKISDGQLGSPVNVTSYNQVCLMFNCHSTKHICILVWILQYTSQIPQLLHVYLLCELISFMFLKWLQLGFLQKALLWVYVIMSPLRRTTLNLTGTGKKLPLNIVPRWVLCYVSHSEVHLPIASTKTKSFGRQFSRIYEHTSNMQTFQGQWRYPGVIFSES